ncbi:hypothetical protein [Pediococcus acidilactici]|uniref:hypothetical protein n=1 Tax=Pediococcus acidilactici TaxID=1254 RepID=UPI001F15CEA3|nr:hypothetical protein [Pediococcus acidilactici]
MLKYIKNGHSLSVHKKINHNEDFQKEVNVLMCNDTTKLLLGIDDNHIKIKKGARKCDGVIRLEGT